MEFAKNLVEYYDELFSVTHEQKQFFSELLTNYSRPAKILNVGCGTGFFDHMLAKEGNDVTGIDPSAEILRSANLRRRNQLMSIRFFQMSYIDMARFLGKKFYDVISVLNDKIMFVHDRTLMRKFFYDCHELLAPGGSLVLELVNFELFPKNTQAYFPVRESVRSRLLSTVSPVEEKSGERNLNANVETGNGHLLPVYKSVPIYPLLPDEIENFAEEAGFSSAEFYADFSRAQFIGNENSFVVIIR